MTNEPAILTHGLTKSYGHEDAVRGLDLSIGRNRITAFLGRNGAGKSTTIKMLLGLIRPTSGSGTVLGKHITDAEQNRQMRERVAYVAEDKGLYGYMTVQQIINFARSFYSDWHINVEKKLLLDSELPANRKIKSLSKGMRTKLALVLALSRRPELLILDEPSEGLDPVGIEFLLRTLVSCSADGIAVFFSSHQIAEVERVADQICILEKGRLLMNTSVDQLRQSYRQIDMVFPSPPPKHEFKISGVERVTTAGNQVRILSSCNAEAVVERAHNLSVVSVEVAPVSLRDVFLETVREN
jgi:ABC-2 type transport system ATP-binding protein